MGGLSFVAWLFNNTYNSKTIYRQKEEIRAAMYARHDAKINPSKGSLDPRSGEQAGRASSRHYFALIINGKPIGNTSYTCFMHTMGVCTIS